MSTVQIIHRPSSTVGLLSPQLVLDARVLYFGYLPAEPDAAAALLPVGLRAAEGGTAFLTQYVVDSDEQTSGFGRYSLTYMGIDLADLNLPDGTPGRWMLHYLNSNAAMREYARERGFPVEGGDARTVLDADGGVVTATTTVDGVPTIRTRARADPVAGAPARGQVRYLTRVGDNVVSGRYPLAGRVSATCEVLSLEFLAREHPTYALRPRDPLSVTWSMYFPRLSFCYPGGEEVLA